MKFKECPISLVTALKLKSQKVRHLHHSSKMPLPVVVSLTSIPSRLGLVHLTVRSLLAQTYKPELVLLWLNDKLRGQLPASLVCLEGERFQIRFAGLECPHRKLVHSLAAFPDKIIVTCDDDLMYDETWLVRLYRDHLQYPKGIIAHECRRISQDSNGELLPYHQWPVETRRGLGQDQLLPVGYGGVLYPPGSLLADVAKPELFMRLAPRADDLWFKAMAHLAGTGTRRSVEPGNKPIPIVWSQSESLKKTNVKQDGNRAQWRAICEHYNLTLQ